METEQGSFFEYSISHLSVNNRCRLFNKYFHIIRRGNFGDGKSVEKPVDHISRENKGIDTRKKDKYEIASFELITQAKISSYCRMLDYNTYTHFITHPKMLSAHNIKYFRKFLKYATSKYELQTDFEKMKSS